MAPILIVYAAIEIALNLDLYLESPIQDYLRTVIDVGQIHEDTNASHAKGEGSHVCYPKSCKGSQIPTASVRRWECAVDDRIKRLPTA